MTAKAELHELVEGLSEPEAQAFLAEFGRQDKRTLAYRSADGAIDFERLWHLSVEEREAALRECSAEVDLELLAEFSQSDSDVDALIDA